MTNNDSFMNGDCIGENVIVNDNEGDPCPECDEVGMDLPENNSMTCVTETCDVLDYEHGTVLHRHGG